MAETYSNILIVKPSALGDLVQVLPVLKTLRLAYPGAKITWFVRKEYAPLIEGHPDLDDIIIFDRKYLGKAWHNPRAFAELLQLIKEIKRHRFDIVFDFQGLFRTAFFSWISGAQKRFSMAGTRELSSIFYTNRIRQSPASIHLADFYLEIIAAAGVPRTEPQFDLPRDPKAEEAVGRLLTENRISPGRYAVLVPGSAHADKCWPVVRFAELADLLAEKHGLAVVATGTRTESSTVDELAARAGTPVLNLAGRTSIRELTALMRTAAAVVSNDTGPGHIAAALQRPLVLIFGRSNPARVEPYKRPQCVVAVGPYERGLKADNFDPTYDITAITTTHVYEKLAAQLVEA